MTTKRKEKPVTSNTVAPGGASSLAGQGKRGNRPPVSRQTAGGIAGATIGGIVAGPLGSVVAGVAGAMLGNASAARKRPVKQNVEAAPPVAKKPARQPVSSKKKAGSRKTAAKAPTARKRSKAKKK